jgi:citrate lyase subunit beta/citryl-CoA lyase
MTRIPDWTSLLFAPADNEALCAKACGVEADAVILDLEDGVAMAAKAHARARYGQAARALRAAGRSVVARINSAWRMAFADLDACVIADTNAVMVPKVGDLARLRTIDAMIGEIERERGLPEGDIGLIALVESAPALPHLAEIAAGPRLIGLAFGPEDFAVSLGVAPTPEALDMPCRMVALAAATRGLMALAAPISIGGFRDIGAYADALRRAQAYGATGALCIHPAQVAAASEVFEPSAEACALARRTVEAWETAAASGESVTSLEGRMIDLPVVEQAKRLLARRRTPLER